MRTTRSGFWWFPENQQDPNAEWGPASWQQRNHFGFYGAINPKHLLNLGVGVFANSGEPYSILTGDDSYGTNLFNARPDGVARNSEIGPDYADLDLRWGYDFKLHPSDSDKSPTLGLSVASFDVLNHRERVVRREHGGQPGFRRGNECRSAPANAAGDAVWVLVLNRVRP